MSLPARVAPVAPEISGDLICQWGCEVLRTESRALIQLESSLGDSFQRAVRLIADCQGSVLLTGMGKAGWIARKLSATLASTGAPSHYFHPGEAFHGDLGRIGKQDCVWILSQSGETEEVVRLLPTFKAMRTPIVAMTAGVTNSTARAASVVLDLGPLEEACPHGLAPTTSTTAMLALGDAVAISVSRLKGFQAEDFARFHPGGALGRKMAKVEDCMRPIAECRVAPESETVRQVLVLHRRAGRRSGAVLLCDADGKLTGIFTDSDLAKLLEANRDDALDRPICEVMTRRPATIDLAARMPQALAILAERKISELPVVDASHSPVGLIDVTDVVGWNAPDSTPPKLLPFPRGK